MQDLYAPLRRDERITLALRSLYEQYGYRKFRMNRFEAYDFYAPYRDFLSGVQIISFTDLDGKLMALRPDVTLSIVRKAGGGGDERLYYTEPVYRPARGAAGYRESFQVGVEYIGHVTPYATVEILSLALQSLARIAPQSVLDLSHTGYTSGLLTALPLDAATRIAVSRCIEDKNTHEIASIAGPQLSEGDLDRLLRVARLSGPFAQTLQEARALAIGAEMNAAVDELEAVYASLAASGEADPLRLDFSITGDVKYYSGLIFRGYISGVPTAVLTGGRYDPLLRRMGKPNLSAMGFALYFDELARYLSDEADASVDTVVLYPPDASPAAVAHIVQSRLARGERVWAGSEVPQGLSYRQILEVDAHA